MTVRDLTVRHVMTAEPITVVATTPCALAEEKMELADIRHLPVVDSDHRVLGILSERDLRLAEPRESVAAVMVEDVLVVEPAKRICEATAVMLLHKIGALPVVDKDSKLIGILTETDIVRIAHDLLGGNDMSIDD